MTETTTVPYVGRFAPSPTGPLHFGSLVAALGSYLQARSRQGRWLLRIEDLDPPREAPGARLSILKTLETYGFEWDGSVTLQSQRHDFYEDALALLRDKNRLYACRCSRKQIAAANAHTGGNPRRYPGTCRDRDLPFIRGSGQYSLRLRTENQSLSFNDAIQGHIQHNIFQENGDIVLFRRDGFYAYVLAVSIDDIQQGVTEVVRGCDLLDTTASQIDLMQQLGENPPDYVHLPIVSNPAGEKLSKQTGAAALPLQQPVKHLYQALCFLGQSPPADLAAARREEFWQWAQQNWRLERVPPKVTKMSVCQSELSK